MKKKILSLILVLVMVLSLSACGNDNEKKQNDSSEIGSELSKDDSENAEDTNADENGTQESGKDNGNNDSNADESDTDASTEQGTAGDKNQNAGDNSENDKTNTGDKNNTGDKTNTGDKNNTTDKNNTSDKNNNNNQNNNTNNNKPDNNTTNNNQGTSGGQITTSYISSYSATENQLADAVIAKIITSNMGDFQRVKAIHDYLVMNVDYDYKNYQNGTLQDVTHTALGALQNRSAVCDGYAKAFHILCLKSGISCEIVTGESYDLLTEEKIGHAWNQVKVEGSWYNMDVTWDDPVAQGGVKDFNDHSGNSYEYFCVPDSIIYKDHIQEDAKYTCTSPSLYERALKAGVPWDSAVYVTTEAELYTLLENAANANNSVPAFYCKASLLGSDWNTFFKKAQAMSGLERIEKWEYYSYFEGTSDPGTYHKITLTLITENGVVAKCPMMDNVAELKTQLVNTLSSGQKKCEVYINTTTIPWSNSNTAYTEMLLAEHGYYTYLTSYYNAATGIQWCTLEITSELRYYQ